MDKTNIIAGPVFGDEIYIIIFVLPALFLIVTISLFIFLARRPRAKVGTARPLNPFMAFLKIILGMTAVVGGLILIFAVIPAMLKDREWRNVQETCAKEAGYSSPYFDQTDEATPTSQRVYGDCLDRLRSN